MWHFTRRVFLSLRSMTSLAAVAAGGKHELTLPSVGNPPRPSDKQLVPPDPEPAKNLDPILVVEPTVVAPQLATLPPLALFTLGDPNGVPSLPSAGPGVGNGIGTGRN